MQRIPEQAGENGEDQERQRQPEAPQDGARVAWLMAPVFRFDRLARRRLRLPSAA